MRAIVISLAFLAASSNARNLKDCFIQDEDGHSTYQCPGCQMEVDDQGHVSLLQGPDCRNYDIPADEMADEATVQVPGCQRQIHGGQVVEELGPRCSSLSARPWKTKGSSSFFGGSGAHDIVSETLEQVGSALSQGFAGLHKQPSSNGPLSTADKIPNRRCQTINRGNGETVVQCRACQVIIGADGESVVKVGSGCSKYGKQIKKAKAAQKAKKLRKSGKKGRKGKKLGQKTKSDGNGCTTTTDEHGNEVTNCTSCQSVVTINGKTVVSNDCNSDITAIGDSEKESSGKEKAHEDEEKTGKKNQDDDDDDDDDDSDEEGEDSDDADSEKGDDDNDDDEEKEAKEKKEGDKKETEEKEGEKEAEEEKYGEGEKEDDEGSKKDEKKSEKKGSKSTEKKHDLRDADFDY